MLKIPNSKYGINYISLLKSLNAFDNSSIVRNACENYNSYRLLNIKGDEKLFRNLQNKMVISRKGLARIATTYESLGKEQLLQISELMRYFYLIVFCQMI